VASGGPLKPSASSGTPARQGNAVPNEGVNPNRIETVLASHVLAAASPSQTPLMRWDVEAQLISKASHQASKA
jgi:hypothetical protein